MAAYLSPIGNEPQIDSNGDPLVGGKIYTYIATTTTPTDTYTSNTGGTSQANPIILNARGCPANPIWLAAGQSYKFIITDADDVPLPPTLDGITGINDPAFASTSSQWIALGVTPTYLTATTFSLAGDQTTTLQTNRRIQTNNSGGFVHSTVVSSSYSAGSGLTTVTISNDSGSLDAGLASVNYGILSATNPSMPIHVPAANWLHNVDGAITQRSLGSTADDVYAFDRWYALTQTGTVTTSQLTNPEDGARAGMRITQSQAVAQRFGHAQIMEGRDVSQLRGSQVTFGGRYRLSTTSNLRMALLAWTGTEDSVTSDVVNDWTSSTYTAGGFFNSTTLTVVAVTSTALTAATVGNAFVTGTVPSTATNLIVVYWTESTAAQNVTLDAWNQRLVEGTVLAPYIRRTFHQERQICQRFMPSTSSDSGDVGSGVISSTSAAVIDYWFEVEPRIAPTGVTWGGGASLTTGTVTSAVTAIAFSVAGKRSCRMTVTGTGTPYTANHAAILVLSSATLLFTGADL
jgi:hypothetical protein